jgi:hypothetical protein
MPATTSTTQTKSVNTSELQVGDIVWTHGMRVRVEHVATYDGDRGPVWVATGTLLNLDEVKDVIPAGFLHCFARTEAVRPEVRKAHATSHGVEGECWTIQGNTLATWAVEIADEPQAQTFEVGTKVKFRTRDGLVIPGTISGFEKNGVIRILDSIAAYHYVKASAITELA